MGEGKAPLTSSSLEQGRRFWNDVERHLGDDHVSAYWTAHPLVRAHINRLVTGSPDVWPLEWLQRTFPERLPISQAMVMGCGTGGLERDLVQKEIARRVVGVDIAPEPLRYAKETADSQGLGDRISYVQGDARAYLAELTAPIGAIFFHASLHHFDGMHELMDLLRNALDPRGFLYLDEFVGPSMSQWNPPRLLLPNLAYYLLPKGVRRPWLVRTPRNPQDPTEAVCAGDILPALSSRFRVLEKRDYGGNLLSLIYPNLARPGSGRASVEKLERAVKSLLTLERLLLKAGGWVGLRSFYTVIVAEPT